MEPYVQWGFAGFCFVVFATMMTVGVWLIKQLLKILKDTNEVIAGNTAAIKSVHDTADTTRNLMSDIRDQLLQRPCLMPTSEDEERAQSREERLRQRHDDA